MVFPMMKISSFATLVSVLTASILAVLMITATGCNRSESGQEATAEIEPPEFKASDLPDVDEVRDRIDEVLDFTEARHLVANQHAAWQIVHGILAFGPNLRIDVDGELVPALDWLLSGGRLTGWNLRPTEHGLEAPLESGSQTGQGHEDQWLGYLCQCDLPPDQQIIYRGKQYPLTELARQAQWDIREGMEASWTLMGLSTFIPLDSKWTASSGEEWSIERIMQMELDQRLEESPCGGTHRLVGVTMALNRYLAEGGELVGVWKTADERIRWALEKAPLHQQPDGSFSANYFERPASTQNMGDHINSMGHTLEFITYAISQDRLAEPWLVKGVLRLCDLMEITRKESVECGALYHAAHGLVLYRHRRFGPRTYGQSDGSAELTESQAIQ